MWFQRINRKRLWLALTVLWVLGVVVYFAEDIERDYNRSLVAKERADRARHAERFVDCMEQNKENWFSLVSAHLKQCAAQADELCRSSSALWPCEREEFTTTCIRGKSPACGHFYATSVVPSEEDIRKEQRESRREELAYYWNWHAASLQTALLLIVLVPIAMAVAPALLRRLWRWLTTTPR